MPENGAADREPGAADANPELSDLLQAVEANLLGGPLKYTRGDVTAASGTSPEENRALWRALGFATVRDDERVFADADVEALRKVKRLEAVGEMDDDLMRAITRIIGQSFARLASWQGQLVLEIFARRPELLRAGDGERGVALIDELTPLIGDLHDYVWRRQLVAYLARVASNAGAAVGAQVQTAIGFVDMVDFTAFTRRSSEAELRSVLDTFESLASDVVSEHHGQIVKTIGDEVLFTADDPHDAAQIALALLDAAGREDALPPLRAGVAYGQVVTRLGDVYGQPVNIASRLTGIARTDAVLVDAGLADLLHDDAAFVLHAMRPVSVRGYRHLRAWRLRRAAA